MKEVSGDRRECVGDECVRMRVYLAKISGIFRWFVEDYAEMGLVSARTVAQISLRLGAFSRLIEELSGASKGVLDEGLMMALKSASTQIEEDDILWVKEFRGGFNVPISENCQGKADVRTG